MPLESFVVFDLETTGLDALRNEIIEIGAIKVVNGMQQSFQTLVRPEDPVPELITNITGISQAMVDRDGAPLDKALRDFLNFIGRLPLVAFNAEFDMSFLRQASGRYDVTVRNPVTCALEMSRRAWPGRRSYRLSALAKDHKLPEDDTHRALGDCRRTLELYLRAEELLRGTESGGAA